MRNKDREGEDFNPYPNDLAGDVAYATKNMKLGDFLLVLLPLLLLLVAALVA